MKLKLTKDERARARAEWGADWWKVTEEVTELEVARRKHWARNPPATTRPTQHYLGVIRSISAEILTVTTSVAFGAAAKDDVPVFATDTKAAQWQFSFKITESSICWRSDGTVPAKLLAEHKGSMFWYSRSAAGWRRVKHGTVRGTNTVQNNRRNRTIASTIVKIIDRNACRYEGTRISFSDADADAGTLVLW